MTMDIFRIDGSGESPGQTGDRAVESTEFRRILEQLEQLSRNTDRARPAADQASEEQHHGDADELRDALRRAEDDFVAAMDLRRKLEEAFRRAQP